MTNEERAEKLRIDLHNAYWDEELVLILAYSDEIRRECAEIAHENINNIYAKSLYYDPDDLRAAIMGEEVWG